MSAKPILVCLLAPFLGLSFLTGCGDDGQAAKDEAEAAASASSVAAAESSAAAASAAASESSAAAVVQQEVYDACSDAVKTFMTELQEIGSRLNIGMNYDEYGQFLSDARVTYDRAFTEDVVGEMDPSCLSDVAVPLENAFQAYVNVHGIWGDCIEDYDCVFSEGQTNAKAQRGWVRAGNQTSKAVEGLSALSPEG